MKISRIVCGALIVLLSIQLHAQKDGGTLSYKITRDETKDINNFWLNLDLIQMDVGFKNVDGISINTGLNGLGMIQNRFGFDYTLRYGYLTLGKLRNKDFKSAYQVELGGFLNFSDNTRTKNVKVVLKFDKGTNMEGKTVETTTFTHVPGGERIIRQLRGGLYMRRNPFVQDNEDLYATDYEANANSIGVYAGLGSMRIHNLFINTDKFGKCYNSGIFRFYADVLILPVVHVGLNGESFNEQIKPGHFGARFGCATFAPDNKKNAKKGGFGIQVEAGYRPLDGLYTTCSFYWTIQRKKLKAFGGSTEVTSPTGGTIEKE